MDAEGRLQGRVVAVTGGGTGLGRAIVEAAASAGARVAVGYGSSTSTAQELVARLTAEGVGAVAVGADLRDPDAPIQFVDQVVDGLGGLDVLVNNAAMTHWAPMKDLDAVLLEDWDEIQNLNVKAPFLLSRAAASHLGRRGGGIVNVASMAGLIPSGSSMAYCVSKASLIHLTRCLAVALAPDVRVNAVAPGYMETRWTDAVDDRQRSSLIDSAVLRRPTMVEDVATTVIELAANSSVTGQVVPVDSGIVIC